MAKCCGLVIPTIDALKENIRRAIREIEPQTIENVLQNCLNRMGYHLKIVVIL
jgi:restriction endonuclease Mrr